MCVCVFVYIYIYTHTYTYTYIYTYYIYICIYISKPLFLHTKYLGQKENVVAKETKATVKQQIQLFKKKFHGNLFCRIL